MNVLYVICNVEYISYYLKIMFDIFVNTNVKIKRCIYDKFINNYLRHGLQQRCRTSRDQTTFPSLRPRTHSMPVLLQACRHFLFLYRVLRILQQPDMHLSYCCGLVRLAQQE